MGKHRPMSDERKELFLEHLRQHGLVMHACRHASPQSKLGAHVTFYAERHNNPEFADAWEEAIKEADERVLQELKRRGIDGYEEDVFGSLGGNNGTGVVGQRMVYSDKLAELYARINSIRVREALRNKVEVTAEVKVAPAIDVNHLSPAKQELLRQLLEPEDETE